MLVRIASRAPALGCGGAHEGAIFNLSELLYFWLLFFVFIYLFIESRVCLVWSLFSLVVCPERRQTAAYSIDVFRTALGSDSDGGRTGIACNTGNTVRFQTGELKRALSLLKSAVCLWLLSPFSLFFFFSLQLALSKFCRGFPSKHTHTPTLAPLTARNELTGVQRAGHLLPCAAALLRQQRLCDRQRRRRRPRGTAHGSAHHCG
jgi:hypothetical protein